MKNKREDKIVFNAFPGEKKAHDKIKKILLVIILIIILIALYVSSSIFNERILYGSLSVDYKTVNKFDSNYASVFEGNREKLLKDIGFTSVMLRKKQLSGNVYDASYAYKKVKEYDDKIDEITVVYDNDDKVKYIELSLVYLKDDFSISNVAADSNAILKNYVLMTTPKNAIAEAKNNGYYYYNDSKTKNKASYILTSLDKKYYTLKVIISV